jgi:hypothetical protein
MTSVVKSYGLRERCNIAQARNSKLNAIVSREIAGQRETILKLTEL